METEILQKKEKKRVPNLRFGEFEEEWVKNKLGEISEFSKGKNISKADIVEDGKLECIRYGELYTYYNEVIFNIKSKTNLHLDNLVLSEVNDVIIPASGETNVDIATASCILRKGIAIGGDLNIIRSSIDGAFLSYYLNNRKKFDIARLSQGNSVVHLYSKQLKSLNLNLPSTREQQKITTFLSAVDKKIQQLNRKKQLLETYKKGVMQQLFSQRLRFKPALSSAEVDENGKDFPEWEEKRLNDICEMTSSKRVYLSDYVKDGIPFYRGKEISELKSNKIPSDILYISKDRYEDFKAKYGVPLKNDILITAVGTLGNVWRIKDESPFYFKDGNLIWLRKITENPEFVEVSLQWNSRKILNSSIGSSQKALTMVELLKLKFDFPSIQEQQKIADFLSEIDIKIETVSQQITKTQSFKKGLLQQMFI